MQTPVLLREWTPEQFEIIEKDLSAHFSNIPFTISTSKQQQYKNQKRTFDDLDIIFGLAYTSTGNYAGYFICNVELYADRTGEFKINGFAMDNNCNVYAVMMNNDEEQKIVPLADSNNELNESERLQYNLKKCTVEGHNIKLPTGARMAREEYEEIKKHLELIGGKWTGGKTQAFVFKESPSDYLHQLKKGEKLNIKKEYQFFGTPEGLADQLVELAELRPHHDILEPSAGQGAIVKAIKKELGSGFNVYGYELMPLNQTFLNKITGFQLLGNDFLIEADKSYDRIIANPPFSKNQDITHILKMYDCLKPGGRIVTIASNHWHGSDNKKEKAFREFLENLNVEPIEVKAGEFKESGTGIAACILVIDKPTEIAPKKKSIQQSTLF